MFPAPVAATTIPSAPAATAASSSEPSIATVAVMRWTRSAARVGLDPPSAGAPPEEHDLAGLDPAERAAVRAGERVERRGVHLDHVVGRLDRPARQTTTPAPRIDGGGRDPDRVAQVGRPVEAGLVRRAHRAGHDDRLRPVEDEIPAERGLLDRVGALDDDRAVDRRVGQRLADDRRRSRAAPGT